MSFPVPQNVADYAKLIEDGVPFTHTNIGGDGEFLAIVGAQGVNSDGRTYNPEKGAELAKVLLEPRLTLHGFNPGGHHKDAADKPCLRRDAATLNGKRAAAEDWLVRHGINVPENFPGHLNDPDFGLSKVNVRWVHKEILSSANARGELGPFIGALRKRPLIVVGPTSISYDFVFGALRGAAEVLTSATWEDMHRVEYMVREELENWRNAGAVVSWSMGYLTKVLMWRIAPDYPDITQIDMGACWEAYCGKHSRHGYKLPEWPERMKKNLREAGAL